MILYVACSGVSALADDVSRSLPASYAAARVRPSHDSHSDADRDATPAVERDAGGGKIGDGRIGAYQSRHFAGPLEDSHGKPIAIDGLWALLPGTATSDGVDSVWFSAGPDEEANGLVGLLTPATS